MASVREVAFELELLRVGRRPPRGRWALAGASAAAGSRGPCSRSTTGAGRRKRSSRCRAGSSARAEDEAGAPPFAWPGDPAEIIGAELEVGRNVVVDLPLPDRKRRRRRRRPSSFEVRTDEGLRAEVGALRAQVERLRAELAGRERETCSSRRELDAATPRSPPSSRGRDEQRTVAIEELEQATAETARAG